MKLIEEFFQRQTKKAEGLKKYPFFHIVCGFNIEIFRYTFFLFQTEKNENCGTKN